MEITQEELKRFWEWCGFKYHTYPEHWYLGKIEIYGTRWITPDGKYALLDVPILNLDNLFEYAVPKIRGLKYPIIDEICFGKEDDKDLAMIIWWTGKPKTDTYGCGVFSGKGNSEKEALFRAIQEVIQEK
jgi:hypothetical protein